jgi:MFS transporter, FSR family, fosmidomycin resistance protein
MAPLSLGHGCADMCQGAVPALLPSLIAARGLSVGAATALVSVATIGSSIVQPLFGIWSDRLSVPLLAPLGVLVAALGLGAVGLCHSYAALACALAISGLGVALFHPEGARMAGIVGGGSARGMSYFSVGGNVGFALGPAAVLAVVTLGGLGASPLLAVPGVLAAAVLLVDARRVRLVGADAGSARPRAAGPVTGSGALPIAQWGPFSRLAGAAVARTAAFFALQAFVPIYLIDHLHRSHAVASVALIVMLGAGAVGTLVGSRCADRFGRRLVLIWAMLPLTVLLALLPLADAAGAFALLVGIGLMVDGPFATTVVMGQQYLPGRAGLASGITLGLAIGLGGLLATGLGAVADVTSVRTVLMILPLFSLAALALAWSLPAPAPAAAPTPVTGAVNASSPG